MLYNNHTLFIHIPKTGGTSLVSHICRCCDLRPNTRIDKHITLQALHNRGCGKVNVWDTIVTLIRNPYARMVSLYYFMLRIHRDGLYGGGQAPAVQLAVEAGSFKGFLRAAAAKPRQAWFPYNAYIEIDGVIPNNVRVYRLEDKGHEMLAEIVGLFGGEHRGELGYHVVTKHPHWETLYDAEVEDLVYSMNPWAFKQGHYERW